MMTVNYVSMSLYNVKRWQNSKKNAMA